jgi:hypothetical protein
MSSQSVPWVWDYDIDGEKFQAILRGELQIGRLDRDWAAVRLLEYAPYAEIVDRLGFAALIAGWPAWRLRMRSLSRRRGMDFVVSWVRTHRPDLVE